MRILITGINGFIGEHLGIELLKRGHFVTGIGQSRKCKIDNIKIYHEGTVLDKRLVEKATKNVEIVVHLAALTAHKDITENKFITLDFCASSTYSIARRDPVRQLLCVAYGVVNRCGHWR